MAPNELSDRFINQIFKYFSKTKSKKNVFIHKTVDIKRYMCVLSEVLNQKMFYSYKT